MSESISAKVAAAFFSLVLLLAAASFKPSVAISGEIFLNACDQWVEVAKSLASDAEAVDLFGRSVSISGDTAIVGADLEDTGGSGAGAAYIFERNAGGANNWAQVRKIMASDADADDRFGISVSISGDTAIVGAIFEGTAGSATGAAYIFERNQGGAGNWGEVRKILASDRQDGDRFGFSVSISGDTAIVGADSEDTGGISAGAAYIFERNAGGSDNWGQVRKIQASDREIFGEFGISVSINGDTAIAGARLEDTAAMNAGAAYIFERNMGGPDNWGQVRKVLASDAEVDDSFGSSVAISGDTVIVCAPLESTGGLTAGAAYVFERNAGGANNWDEVRKILASDSEAFHLFGTSVSISGDSAIVGVQFEDTGGREAGAAYIFGRNQGGPNNWGEVRKILASDAEADDRFGTSVSISGDSIIVGAPLEDTGGSSAGVAYLFTMNCPPAISTQPFSLQRNSSTTAATIAAVSDDLTAAASLSVTIASSPAGITLSNITNTGGAITADVSAGCSAALGPNTVTLSVMDEHGLVSMADLLFTVTAETTPPVVSCPANMTVSTDAGQCSAVVNFTATATDNCDGSITPVCNPPSGSSFPVGTTFVNCAATDTSSNSAQCSFTITVADAQAPAISCPAPISVANAANQCSAVVNFSATAADNCAGVLTLGCSPPSGSAFPIGPTTVTCTATDTVGIASQCSFTVTVRDTQKPSITCPSNILIQTFNPGDPTVVVNFSQPFVSDNCSASVVCTPPSGSSFPIGSTMVNCTATDPAGNSTSCGFQVNVIDFIIKHDTSNIFFQLSSATGDYEFIDCSKGLRMMGRAIVTKSFCKIEVRDGGPDPKKPDRNAYVLINPCTKGASATVQIFSIGRSYTITDSDITNNRRGCP